MNNPTPTTLRELLDVPIPRKSQREAVCRQIEEQLKSLDILQDESLPLIGKVSSVQLGFIQTLVDDRNKFRAEIRKAIEEWSK